MSGITKIQTIKEVQIVGIISSLFKEIMCMGSENSYMDITHALKLAHAQGPVLQSTSSCKNKCQPCPWTKINFLMIII